MTKILAAAFAVLMSGAVVSCQGPQSFELSETSKLLGTKVKEFPASQGLTGFDDIDPSARQFNPKTIQRPLTGPTPRPHYEQRKTIRAVAPDGTVYEGWYGRFEEGKVLPGPGQSSNNGNPRQRYPTHFGYGFNPADVFIGRKESGKIKTSLFFRDIGSHETAPYHFTVDSAGLIHLIVADVNIGDNNELNIYSLVGDPKTGKWLDAVMLDRRGFTSWSYPWSGTSGDTVHLLWTWGDATHDKGNPTMGLFYVDQTSGSYGRKKRLIKGLVESYDAAIDTKTGLLIVAAVTGNKVFVTLRDPDGSWRKPTELVAKPRVEYISEVSTESVGNGSFIVRSSAGEGIEWLVRPQ